jgi:hypothetical protein
LLLTVHDERRMGFVLAQDLPTTESPRVWIFFALAMLALFYMAVLRPMMRRKKDPLERGSGFSSLSQQRAVERQMQNLLVELSEMSRQITAQLDTRSAKLELLIKEADEKIAALKRLGASEASAPASPILEDPEPAGSLPPAPVEIDPRHAAVYSLADEGRDIGEIATTLGRPRGEVELILALRGEKV